MLGGIGAFSATSNGIALGIGDSFLHSWNLAVSWLPNIFIAFVILLFGAYIAKLVRELLKRILKAVKFDQWVDKFGVTNFLKSAGITISVSNIFLWLVYWVVALVFLNSAANVLGIPEISDFVQRLVEFIPQVFAGLIIMIIGLVAAHAVSDMLNGVTEGKAYKAIARWVIVIIAFVAALEQIGFNVNFITSNLNIILAGIMLAVGLAFGLGGKDKAKEFLDRHLK